jgi:hypothetical protein
MKRNYAYSVHDIRTNMSEFVASFAVRAHAERWGREMFGEFAFVTDRGTHQTGQMWDGNTVNKDVLK